MPDYQICDDIEVICELLNLTYSEFADEIGVSADTISRWRKEKNEISPDNINKIYDFAFGKGIRLNKIKEQLYKEDCTEKKKIILFHGAKTVISGELSADKSKGVNDFGKGFYCGESLEQSAMFVSGYPASSLYILEFDKSDLRCSEFSVNREWMLAIAYYRGKLDEYKNHSMIKQICKKVENSDYIIAPIADNRMFEIIDSFIDGEITDIQCQHCLSATNLGNQFVLKNGKAVEQIEIKRHCYLSEKEKQFYLNTKLEESKIGNDKVKVARRQYRNQGNYIEEILV